MQWAQQRPKVSPSAKSVVPLKTWEEIKPKQNPQKKKNHHTERGGGKKKSGKQERDHQGQRGGGGAAWCQSWSVLQPLQEAVPDKVFTAAHKRLHARADRKTWSLQRAHSGAELSWQDHRPLKTPHCSRFSWRGLHPTECPYQTSFFLLQDSSTRGEPMLEQGKSKRGKDEQRETAVYRPYSHNSSPPALPCSSGIVESGVK